MPPSIIKPCVGVLDSIHAVPAISLVLITFFGVITWNVVYNLFFSPLAKFPGPKLAACSNLPIIYWTCTGQLHTKLLELHNKYGDVVRTGPSALTYRSTQGWKDIYGHRKAGAGSFLKDPTFFPVGPYGTNLLNSNDEDHARERRLLSHAFSERSLREQEELIQSYADLLVSRLSEVTSASKSTVDLSRWYNYTTFDIIGDLAYGEPFDCLKNSEYHPWVSMVFTTSKGSTFLRAVLTYPWLGPAVKLFLPRETMRLRRKHMEMSAQKAQRRLDRKTDRPDFMTAVLKNEYRTMSENELKANASLFIIAGSETTASLLSGFTYYLLDNSAAYQKLKKEVRDAFKSYDEITFQAVGTLPYLNAALEEGLRCYPPVAGVLPRVVPKGGSMIDGEFVPEGTSVAGAHFATYHAESHFTEPDSFIPERWLENREKRFESDNFAALSPFSLGPRNCIGKNLAYAEMRVIAAKMIWTFDMTLDPVSTGWNNQRTFIVWERKPLMVHLSKVVR